jgi:protein TonB
MSDPGCGLAEEAERVVKNMPRWEPGYNNFRAVRVRINLPIRFELE